MGGPLLEVAGLDYWPGGCPVLDRVELTVAEGDCLAVIGPNGAGKSSLIKHLVGILPDRRGAVRLQGRPLSGWDRRALARQLAYVPQTKGYIPPFRVSEFLMMGRYPYWSAWARPGDGDRARIQSVLVDTGLAGFEDRALDTLSGGERQKAYLAAALVQDTPLLVLDEPTTYLDPGHAGEVLALLARFHRQAGRTVVMVTHDLNAALTLATRVVALKGGRVAVCADVGTVRRGDCLADLFGVPFASYRPERGDGPPVWLPRGVGG